MKTSPKRPAFQLPDDIEQRLIEGQRSQAVRDLAARRGVSSDAAQLLIARWLYERKTNAKVSTASSPPSLLRRKTD